MDSPKILEAKMLYFYGLILLNLLSIKYPGLEQLIQTLNEKCKNLEEFGKMQYIFDYIEFIENEITKNLKNDELICILIECLLSPYKAKIVFDEFYEKKNFYKEAIKSRKIKEDNRNNIIINEETGAQKKKSDIENLENENNRDKTTVMTHYYEDNENVEVANENAVRKSLSINMLLIHPFYSNTKLDEEFLRYLFEQNNNKME